MSYFNGVPLTPAEIAAKEAKFAAKQAAAAAIVAVTPASFPSNAERLSWYRAKLTVCPKWALRALVVIYAAQTADEQATQATKEWNGVGFGGLDATILSSFAQRVEAWNAEGTNHKYATPLSPKQMAILFRKMGKYAGQLIAHLDAIGKAIPVVHVAKAKKVDAPAIVANKIPRSALAPGIASAAKGHPFLTCILHKVSKVMVTGAGATAAESIAKAQAQVAAILWSDDMVGATETFEIVESEVA